MNSPEDKARGGTALTRLAGNPFVGRAPLVAAARGAFDAARKGRGQCLLFWGEAGIGKTRFSDEVVALGQRDGFRPVTARCHELEGAPAFWPWIQIVRRLIGCLPPEAREEFLAGPGRPLSVLLVEGPATSSKPQSTLVVDRYAVFDAVSQLIARVSRESPLLIVIDDLHWADPATVLLLRYAIRELRFEPVVCVGLYRDDEVPPGGPLAEGVSALVSESDGFRLEGLDDMEIEGLVSHVVGFEVADVFLAALRAHTGGNPLFVSEILRMLASEDRLGDPESAGPDSIPLPASVLKTLARRLDGLDPTTQRVLQQASVLGREFEREVLESAFGDAPKAAAALAEARTARLIEAMPDVAARFRFAHDLVRETVHQSLSPVDRSDLNLRAAEALKATRPRRLADHYAAMVVHYLETAQPAGGRSEAERRSHALSAYDYAVLGARRATSRFSFELAATLLRQAQRSLDLIRPSAHGGPDANQLLARRGETSIMIGDALWQAGQGAEAEAADREALEIARQLNDPRLHARAAIGLTGRNDLPLDPTAEHIRLLREAYERIVDLDPGLQVRVLAQLVRASSYGDERTQLVDWAQESIALAEALGEPATLFAARESLHYALLLPGELERRLGVSRGLPSLAREAGSVRLEVIAWLWLIFDLMQIPDITESDRAIARLDELTRRLRQPFWEWLSLGVRACRAQMEGQLEEVERLVFKALEVGQRTSTPNALLFFGTQLFHLREEQRRADELLPVMEQIVRERPGLPVFTIGIPLIHALAGREAEARQTFEPVAAKDFRDVPNDFHRLPMLCSCAAVAAFLGDAPRARILRSALREHAGRVVMAGVVTYWGGSVDHSLGRLEETLGQFDAAEACYATTVDIAARAGARLHEAHALVDRARMLRRLGASPEADSLAARAETIFQDRGIHHPAEIVPRVAIEPSKESTEPEPLAHSRSDEIPPASFERREHSWLLTYAEQEVVLPKSKGLAYLQRLIAAPEEEIHVLDLVGTTTLAEPEGLVESGGEGRIPGARLVESSLESIDPQALQAYRARLRELAAEREVATADRDLSRLEAIDAEGALIEAELSRAMGLGDRIRRTNSATERARKAVYNRLRASIRRIALEHEALGRHLERSVSTGSVCAYRPATAIRWKLR